MSQPVKLYLLTPTYSNKPLMVLPYPCKKEFINCIQAAFTTHGFDYPRFINLYTLNLVSSARVFPRLSADFNTFRLKSKREKTLLFKNVSTANKKGHLYYFSLSTFVASNSKTHEGHLKRNNAPRTEV